MRLRKKQVRTWGHSCLCDLIWSKNKTLIEAAAFRYAVLRIEDWNIGMLAHPHSHTALALGDT